jgi:alpha/beta superfamily hydrolase
MKNYVIAALWEALAAAGVAVLRFNFRGVGRSEGAHDEGVGELDDVRAALAHLAATPGVDPDRLAVAGYSFGAWVGSRAVTALPQVRALALVAPPLSAWPLRELESEPRPKLVVAGDRDDYCPLSLLLPWVARLPEPKERVILEGVDHFFGGRDHDVAAAVAGFFARNSISRLSQRVGVSSTR